MAADLTLDNAVVTEALTVNPARVETIIVTDAISYLEGTAFVTSEYKTMLDSQGGGGGGSTRPTSGFMYPRRQC